MTFIGEAKTVRKPRPTKQMILASDWSKNVACRRGTKRTKVPAVTHSRSRKLASGACPIRRVNRLDRPTSPSRTHRARPPAIRTSPPARSRVPIRCRTVPGINRLIRAPRPPHTGQDACRVPRDRPHGPGGRRQRRRRRPHLRELRRRGSRIRQGCFRQVPRALVRLTSSRASNPRGLYSPISAAPHPATGNPRVNRSTQGAHTPTPRGRNDRPVAPPSLYTARHDRARFGTTTIDPASESPMPNVASPSTRGAVFLVFFGFFVKTHR